MNGGAYVTSASDSAPLERQVNRSGPVRGSFGDLARRVIREPMGLVGTAIIVVLIGVALAAPLIAPYSVDEQPGERLESPNRTYWLGTDEFGRDIFSRMVFGAQISLQVGLIAVGIALVFGGAPGVVSGYYLGLVDSVIQRLVDILLAFPTLILVIAMATVMGASTRTAMIAIGIAYAPAVSRVARSATLVVMKEPYVDAAITMGGQPVRIMTRYVLPNIAAPLIVQCTLLLSTAILAEAALSFLGLGTQPPAASWGAMLGTGRSYMETAPWVAVFPGLAISITVLGFNLLGDALRDALDPRLRPR